MRLSAFTGRNTAHHLGTIGNRLLGVESALLAGETLADNAGIFINEYAH
jgi:hypothetical protein